MSPRLSDRLVAKEEAQVEEALAKSLADEATILPHTTSTAQGNTIDAQSVPLSAPVVARVVTRPNHAGVSNAVDMSGSMGDVKPESIHKSRVVPRRMAATKAAGSYIFTTFNEEGDVENGRAAQTPQQSPAKRKRSVTSRVACGLAERANTIVQSESKNQKATETPYTKGRSTTSAISKRMTRNVRSAQLRSDTSIFAVPVLDDDKDDEDFDPDVKCPRKKNASKELKQYSLRRRQEADLVAEGIEQKTQEISTKDNQKSEEIVVTKATTKVVKRKTATPSTRGSLRGKVATRQRNSTESKASLSTPQASFQLLSKKKKPVRFFYKFTNKHKVRFGSTPFPKNTRPSRVSCHEVFDILKQHHERDNITLERYPTEKVGLSDNDVQGPMHAGEGVIFDAIVRTILSQATNNENAQTVERTLIHHFRYDFLGVKVKGSSPNYHAMRRTPVAVLAKTLASGGLHNMKAKLIQGCLDQVYKFNMERATKEEQARAEQLETGEAFDFVPSMLSLDYMLSMSLQEKFDHLVSMPGIGVKTAACILSFNFEYPVFAVDTHVWRLSRMLKWLPLNHSNVDHAFMHLDKRIPNELKYGLHQAFWHHGQFCVRCRAGTDSNTKGWSETVCPIEHLVDRSRKDLPKATKKPKVVESDENAEKPNKEKKRPNVYPHSKLTPEQAAELGYVLRTIMIDDGFGVRRANFNGKPLLKWVLSSDHDAIEHTDRKATAEDTKDEVKEEAGMADGNAFSGSSVLPDVDDEMADAESDFSN